MQKTRLNTAFTRPRVFAAAVCCCLMGAAAAVASGTANHLALKSALQDTRFTGTLGAGGQKQRSAEELSFENGMFTSSVCRQYGFPSVPYWVRRDSDGLHFLALLKNPDNGTIRFKGTFDGETMHATAKWTKHRWYWTVEQTLVFTGKPASSPE